MPIYRLSADLAFPAPQLADGSGLLAVGGDLSAERLLLAYSNGIFPWPVRHFPLAWFSPDPRFVVTPEDVHVGKNLRKTIRRETFQVTMDMAFSRVIRACALTPRNHEDGTWITEEMIEAYQQLHRLGFAHSVEAWQGERLVGGLYGISIGSMFCGESMFYRVSDASKVCFALLATQLRRWRFRLIDCQVYTDNLARFGAWDMARQDFLGILRKTIHEPTRRETWRMDEDIVDEFRS